MGRGQKTDEVWLDEPLFEVTGLPANDWTMTPEYWHAVRENWARGVVAASGQSWETFKVKFSGAVVPR